MQAYSICLRASGQHQRYLRRGPCAASHPSTSRRPLYSAVTRSSSESLVSSIPHTKSAEINSVVDTSLTSSLSMSPVTHVHCAHAIRLFRPRGISCRCRGPGYRVSFSRVVLAIDAVDPLLAVALVLALAFTLAFSTFSPILSSPFG